MTNSRKGMAIDVTSMAIKELKRIYWLVTETSLLRIRVAMKGGGCSGQTIHMDFTDQDPDEFDLVYVQDAIEFIVDKKSALFVHGATLDFGGGLLDRGFKWSLPTSTGGCGCGTSFSF